MTAHSPVLLQESIQALEIKDNGIYIDGTFGRGGHSRSILNALNENGRLIAIDKDEQAIAFAGNRFAKDPRFQIVHGSFAEIGNIAKKLEIFGKVNGILLDLGVSSPQLDEAARGFSFMQSGSLDMRMNQTKGFTAAQWINKAEAKEMASVFKEYGEEKFANRIANAIARERENKSIETTAELAEIVKAANPKWEKHKHPATRVFQAIRIFINQELEDLKACLHQSLDVLEAGGRLAVISFHSLEDRIVKDFMRSQEKGPEIPPGVPVRHIDIKTNFRRIGKAIKPNEQEISQNVRARSAVLRIGEKIA
ncbi:S-adenosyl-dependent methyltransferase activity on membrane-located substrates (plasmid) [Legionella adelaidensis]|uniref:Ribosomal RNA small subunit methyltransferase H n=1 Tax=Legionella adelaidensis TaxID=45056 RepID=A0A0W0R4X4_9GAMM|nr:16S rRNA (cytosine(1402)-N(4))-methyltransferase RsmH [Legionella adelaidensis]KTC66107.1 Ribosomal RNA small subunit methyltransferase H [Legionella adelaidensis]VEH85823.1 S-adenosyl-dependent methyltransferase activity on membrane-located substrates [Legionella adelaidensis]